MTNYGDFYRNVAASAPNYEALDKEKVKKEVSALHKMVQEVMSDKLTDTFSCDRDEWSITLGDSNSKEALEQLKNDMSPFFNVTIENVNTGTGWGPQMRDVMTIDVKNLKKGGTSTNPECAFYKNFDQLRTQKKTEKLNKEIGNAHAEIQQALTNARKEGKPISLRVSIDPSTSDAAISKVLQDIKPYFEVNTEAFAGDQREDPTLYIIINEKKK